MMVPSVRREKFERIQLVAGVQIAREDVSVAVARAERVPSARATARVAAAKVRFALLNRALALTMLEDA